MQYFHTICSRIMLSIWYLKKSAKFITCQFPFMANLPNVMSTDISCHTVHILHTQHSHAHTHVHMHILGRRQPETKELVTIFGRSNTSLISLSVLALSLNLTLPPTICERSESWSFRTLMCPKTGPKAMVN